MSVRVTSWVWAHSPVKHRGDLLVLLVLADHAHDDGAGAYPSVRIIANKARLSRRGAFDALARLKKVGAIVADGTGPRGTVAYRIVMEGVQSLHGATTAPVQSPTPGGAVTDTPGVQGTAPEPSLNRPEPSDPPTPRKRGARESRSNEDGRAPRNSRAHGTDRRTVDKRHADRIARDRARAAVAALTATDDTDLLAWNRIRERLRCAAPERSWSAWLERVRLVGVDSGQLVLDAPPDARGWLADRWHLVCGWFDVEGAAGRLATDDEHRGLSEPDHGEQLSTDDTRLRRVA